MNITKRYMLVLFAVLFACCCIGCGNNEADNEKQSIDLS